MYGALNSQFWAGALWRSAIYIYYIYIVHDYIHITYLSYLYTLFKLYAICFILIDRRQGQNYDWQARWETYVSLFSLWLMEFWICFVNVLWCHSFFVTLSIKINTINSTIGNICHKWLVGLGKSTVDQVFRETACPSLGWIHLASCQKLVPRCGGCQRCHREVWRPHKFLSHKRQLKKDAWHPWPDVGIQHIWWHHVACFRNAVEVKTSVPSNKILYTLFWPLNPWNPLGFDTSWWCHATLVVSRTGSFYRLRRFGTAGVMMGDISYWHSHTYRDKVWRYVFLVDINASVFRHRCAARSCVAPALHVKSSLQMMMSIFFAAASNYSSH